MFFSRTIELPLGLRQPLDRDQMRNSLKIRVAGENSRALFQRQRRSKAVTERYRQDCLDAAGHNCQGDIDIDHENRQIRHEIEERYKSGRSTSAIGNIERLAQINSRHHEPALPALRREEQFVHSNSRRLVLYVACQREGVQDVVSHAATRDPSLPVPILLASTRVARLSISSAPVADRALAGSGR